MSSEVGKQFPQYCVAIVATIGALACGAALGWAAPASNKLGKGDDQLTFPMTSEDISWATAVLAFGTALASFPLPLMVKFLGRKWSLLVLVLPFMVGWGLVIGAQSVLMMVIGRIILGVAVGGNFIAASPYIGEISDKKVRGRLCSFFQLMITVGILFVYVLGAFVSVKAMSIVCAIIPLVFFVLFMFMPETPNYHIARGKQEKAVQSLIWLRGPQFNALEEVQKLKNEMDEEAKLNTTITEMLKSRVNQRALMVSFSLMIAQQVTAINIIIFYVTDIFDRAGIKINPNYATILIGFVQTVATFISSMIIDKVGRKILLISSITVIGTCYLLLGFYFYAKERTNVDAWSWAPVLILSLFIMFFAFGMGPIPWVVIGEIFGNDIKNVASSVSCFIAWILNFAVAKSFNVINQNYGMAVAFWIYALPSYIFAVFMYFFVPETKGLSLHEIQKMLE